MRRDHVASTSTQRQFGTKFPLGLIAECSTDVALYKELKELEISNRDISADDQHATHKMEIVTVSTEDNTAENENVGRKTLRN